VTGVRPSRPIDQRGTVSEKLLNQILKQLDVMRTIPSTARSRRRIAVDHIVGDRRFDTAQVTKHNIDTLRNGLRAAELDGVVAEFGVYTGATLTAIAEHFAPQVVHGFDSFQGLPEAWGGTDKGRGDFDIGGTPPELPVSNVEFHVGQFDETVPQFAETGRGPFAFVHLDADLYSSTKTVFDALQGWFVPGTVIVFDEYFGYHGWRHHEHRAFEEFLDATGLSFRALSIGHMNLAVRLTDG
jgi:hypothetical protein